MENSRAFDPFANGAQVTQVLSHRLGMSPLWTGPNFRNWRLADVCVGRSLCLEQFPPWAFQSVCNLLDVIDRDVALCPLD